MQMVKLVPVEVSPIGVQSDVVVPAIPIVVKGVTRA